MNLKDPQPYQAPNGRPEEEQPRWRQDFPVDWPQDEYVSRREFVKFLLLTSLAFTTGQFWFLVQNQLRQMQAPHPEQEIVAVADLPKGQSMLFRYPDQAHSPHHLLIHLEDDSFVAYEQQCTHLTCPVIPDIPKNELHCPCHEGHFDIHTGRPLAGPPRRPLAKVTLAIRNGKVYATGLEKRTV